MTDPFLIAGPAVISFSGGRTSAYMLRRILDAHGGTLPPDVVTCFANTGKERPETLDFVQECGSRWGVPINWLEWRDGELGYERVSHNSASRKGEPFEALIARKRYLPNGVTRFCTIELKIRVIKHYAQRTLEWPTWTMILGLRADEMRRVHKACDATTKEVWRNRAPLADAGITKADVMAFWRCQPFDLRLQPHEGNCDLCFLKSREKLRRIMYDRPDLAPWWIEQERRAREEYGASAGSRFRPPYAPDYADLFATRRKQEELDLDEPDALGMCLACTD